MSEGSHQHREPQLSRAAIALWAEANNKAIEIVSGWFPPGSTLQTGDRIKYQMRVTQDLINAEAAVRCRR